MKIGIDIDDTLTDSYEVIVDSLCEYYNVDKSYIINNNLFYEEFVQEFDNYLEFCHKKFDTIIPTAKVKENAKYVLDELHKLGFYIEFITARHEYEYTNPYETSYKYLKEHNIYFDKLSACIIDKASYCKENNIDLFIDDSMSHVENVKKEGITSLLFTNSYNKDKDIKPRVNNWLEILEYVKNNMI